MNREQRHVVHELAEAYGCETQSYDYEPNKNVVATASRYSYMDVLSVFYIDFVSIDLLRICTAPQVHKDERGLE